MDGKHTTTEPVTADASGASNEGLPIWLTKQDVCAQLSVSPRTVDRLVKRGQILRRKLGRESRFQVVGEVEARAPAIVQFVPPRTSVAPPPSPQLGGAGRLLLESHAEIATLEMAQNYLTQLIGLVDQLVQRVAVLERERGRQLERQDDSLMSAA